MSRQENLDRRHDDGFARMDGTALANVLAAYYRDVGWWVEHGDAAGTAARSEGVVDLRIRRDAEFVLVRCNACNGEVVPQEAVDALFGAMVDAGATGGILVGSGGFTPAAIAAARRHARVKFIDGDGLRTMLGPMPGPLHSAVAPMAALAGKRTPAARTRAGRWLWLFALLGAIAFVAIVHAILERTADTAFEATTADDAQARAPVS